MSNSISPLAFVDPAAKLGDNVTVDAFAFIDAFTEIGDNCHIRPHASVLRGTIMGSNNVIYEGSVIGAEPQDFRWKGEKSYLRIGNNNKIHEHVIINRSIHEGEATEIGCNSYIMAQTHIGHDSKIGDYCVLGNSVKIAGDVKIANYTILSSAVVVHEGMNVGTWAMVKGGTRITGHVPPFAIMAHNPISYFGVNAFIMRKGGIAENIIDDMAKCYRHLYQSNTSVRNAIIRIKEDVDPSSERDAVVDFLISNNMKVAGLQRVEKY
jgi:UDP-N-acetylglucosamine acyltransferase